MAYPCAKRARMAKRCTASFADVKPFVGAVVGRIEGSANDPVLIVNGDKDDIDFERPAVWRILVGGTKLSRGFTVEGLTVPYYRRQTKQAEHAAADGAFGFGLPRRLIVIARDRCRRAVRSR
jgi:hypothetical protein